MSRQTELAQVAYADPCVQGLDADVWQLPETLGHDTRAQEPQPVAPRLAPASLTGNSKKPPPNPGKNAKPTPANSTPSGQRARTLAGVSKDPSASLSANEAKPQDSPPPAKTEAQTHFVLE
jgi:hypothetical protein